MMGCLRRRRRRESGVSCACIFSERDRDARLQTSRDKTLRRRRETVGSRDGTLYVTNKTDLKPKTDGRR